MKSLISGKQTSLWDQQSLRILSQTILTTSKPCRQAIPTQIIWCAVDLRDNHLFLLHCVPCVGNTEVPFSRVHMFKLGYVLVIRTVSSCHWNIFSKQLFWWLVDKDGDKNQRSNFAASLCLNAFLLILPSVGHKAFVSPSTPTETDANLTVSNFLLLVSSWWHEST